MHVNVRKTKVWALLSLLSIVTFTSATTVSIPPDITSINTIDAHFGLQDGIASGEMNTTNTLAFQSSTNNVAWLNAEKSITTSNSARKSISIAGLKIPYGAIPNPSSLVLFIAGFMCFVGLGWIKTKAV